MESKNFSFFLSIIFLNFLSFAAYGLPIAFFPNIAKNHGISALIVGVIFSMCPLGGFVFSFIVGKMLNRWERRRVIIYSQILLGISIIIFGFSQVFDSNFLFVFIALLSRTTQGIAVSCYQTAAYTYIPEYWPEEIDLRIGLLEMTVGFGIGTGPLIGAFLYNLFGYSSVFHVPGIIIGFCGSILAYYILPNDNKKEQEGEPETLSIMESFSDRDMWYCFLVLVIDYGAFTLIMPEMENKIIFLGGRPETASFCLACSQLGYILCIVFLIYSKFDKRRFLFFMANFLAFIGLVFLGFDELVPISNNLALVFITIGIFFLGVVAGFSLIPNISENLFILQKIFPNKAQNLKDNMASGIFGAAIALSEFHGPIIGGFLSDNYGFSKSCLIYSLFVLLFFILYAFHGRGLNYFLETFRLFAKDRKQDRNDLEMKIIENAIS